MSIVEHSARPLTDKQVAILMIIDRGSVDEAGAPVAVDLDQLLERLPYRTSKASMQFSIRALMAHGLIQKTERENRRGRQRATYALTGEGRAVMTGQACTERAGTPFLHDAKTGRILPSVGIASAAPQEPEPLGAAVSLQEEVSFDPRWDIALQDFQL